MFNFFIAGGEMSWMKTMAENNRVVILFLKSASEPYSIQDLLTIQESYPQ